MRKWPDWEPSTQAIVGTVVSMHKSAVTPIADPPIQVGVLPLEALMTVLP